jgi:hypothetical protein
MKLLSASFLLFLTGVIGGGPPLNFTINGSDSFKIVVFSDLFIDNDGSNYAYTMQLIQNVLDIENKAVDADDSPVELVVLMGNTVDPSYQDDYQNKFS